MSRRWRTLRNQLYTALACASMLGCSDNGGSSPDGAAGSGGSPTAGAPVGGSAAVLGGGGASGGAAPGGASGAGAPGGAGAAGSGQGGTGMAGASGLSGGGSTLGGAGGSAAGSGGGTAGNGGSAGFAPCPVNEACKLLPLGDSVTDGLTVAGGYRIHLFELAQEHDKKITFVGGSMNGPTMVAGKSFPRAHEGHSGWTIAQIDGIVPKPALDVAPHIVLLHLGTNDMYQTAAKADERLGALIDQIVETLPNALLVVSTIIPFPGSADNVTTYNAAVPQVVSARAKAGKHVLFVDQFAGFPTSELADGVHPNAAGYARMAGAWYAAISSYLP